MEEQSWDGVDIYAVLRVREDATDDEIEESYRRLAKKTHPDHHPDDAAAHERMQLLNEARALLRDRERRERYDRARHKRHEAAGTTGPPDPELRPAVLDFGVLEQGERRTGTVAVFNHGGPFRALELKDESGDFWSLVNARVPEDEELEDSDFVAFLDFDAHTEAVALGRHSSSTDVCFGSTVATIGFLITVVAGDKAVASDGGSPVNPAARSRFKVAPSAVTSPSPSRLGWWVVPEKGTCGALFGACALAAVAPFLFRRLIAFRSGTPGYMVLDWDEDEQALFHFLNRWTVPLAVLGLVFAVLLWVSTAATPRVTARSARSLAVQIQLSWLVATVGSGATVAIPLYNLFYLEGRADGTINFEAVDYVLLLVEIPMFIAMALAPWCYLYWLFRRSGALLRSLTDDVTV